MEDFWPSQTARVRGFVSNPMFTAISYLMFFVVQSHFHLEPATNAYLFGKGRQLACQIKASLSLQDSIQTGPLKGVADLCCFHNCQLTDGTW